MTSRHGKTETGSHEYHLGGNFFAVAMGSNAGWYIFEGQQGQGAQDTGVDFQTLRACRKWATTRKEAV